MLFESFSIIFVFAAALIFFILRGNKRIYWLMCASILYVAYLDLRAVIIAVMIAALTFLAGKAIDSAIAEEAWGRAKTVTALSTGLCVLLLVFYKFFPLALPLVSAQPPEVLTRIVIPVGFSFYIFEAISYLFDVYRGKYTAEQNLACYLLYILFFGKFVSGPIERELGFEEQLRDAVQVRLFDMQRLVQVLMLILYGCILKLVAADRIAIYADKLFSGYVGYSSTWLIIGSLLYTLQLYCDFAGYSYMAMGVSLLFGIRIQTNFEEPYLSENVTEFWRRWHASLGAWFRDYVYIPLGGNRKGFARKLLNLAVVFVLCGIWHGAGLTFLIWGALHALFIVLDNLLGKYRLHIFRSGMIGRFLSFCAVSFAWIFFRADDMEHAAGYIRTMCTAGFRPHSFLAEFYALGLDPLEVKIMAGAVVFLILCDIIAYCKKRSMPELLAGMPFAAKCAFVWCGMAAVAVLGVYGSGFTGTPLIYMQF